MALEEDALGTAVGARRVGMLFLFAIMRKVLFRRSDGWYKVLER